MKTYDIKYSKDWVSVLEYEILKSTKLKTQFRVKEYDLIKNYWNKPKIKWYKNKLVDVNEDESLIEALDNIEEWLDRISESNDLTKEEDIETAKRFAQLFKDNKKSIEFYFTSK